jgi:hypothetical protein
MDQTNEATVGVTERKREQDAQLAGSAKKILKFVVSAHPNPSDRVSMPFTHRSVLFVDPNRPNVFVAAKFLESKA